MRNIFYISFNFFNKFSETSFLGFSFAFRNLSDYGFFCVINRRCKCVYKLINQVHPVFQDYLSDQRCLLFVEMIKPQLKVFHIPISICLPFQGLDFVVDPFRFGVRQTVLKEC